MSREVEVQNIQMTATAPEDVQLSLGLLTNGELGKNSGVLNTNNGAAQMTDATVVTDWSNTADISKYYVMGRLIPASSTTGKSIFFTPDASGVGKTLKDTPRYYTAVDGGTPTAESSIESSSSTKKNMMATLFAYTTTEKTAADSITSKSFSSSTAWNFTNDDGYYVDIPVWFRTSSTDGATLKVSAYVTKGDGTTTADETSENTTNAHNATGNDLYKAVRVAILNADRTTSYNLIDVKNGSAAGATTIVNYMTTTNTANAVASITEDTTTGVYGEAEKYNGTGTVATLQAGSGTGYGTPTQIWVRVWLEGEDPNCWNDNAGQDFNLSLKFENTQTATSGTNYTAGGTQQSGGNQQSGSGTEGGNGEGG